jgi:hypothetical protein
MERQPHPGDLPRGVLLSLAGVIALAVAVTLASLLAYARGEGAGCQAGRVFTTDVAPGSACACSSDCGAP